MTRETYISQLQSGTKKITFTKVDGSERVMNATLDPAVLNKEYGVFIGEQRNASTLTVFDTDKKDWRAMRLDSIKSFE